MGTHTSMFTSMEDRALLDAAKHLVIEEHLATAALLRALMSVRRDRRSQARVPPNPSPKKA